MSGTIQYTDVNNVVHPTRDITVDIRDAGGSVLAVTSTDANGHYSATVSTAPDDHVFVGAIAQGAGFTVYPAAGGQPEQIDSSPQVATGAPLSISLTADNSGDTSFAVADALVTGVQYAERFNGGAPLPPIVVYLGTPTTAAGKSTLDIASSDAFSWDVVLHEYGHFVAAQLNIGDFLDDSHSFFDNLGEPPHNNPGGTPADAYGKDLGIRLAWSEGFADWFGITAQVAMDAAALHIPNVGDSSYTDAHVSVDLATQAGLPSLGEDNELSVARSLWHVNQDPDIALPDTKIIKALSGTTTLSQAVAALLSAAGAAPFGTSAGDDPVGEEDSNNFACVLTAQAVAPQITAPANGSTATTAANGAPPVQWAPNGGGPSNRLNQFTVQYWSSDWSRLIFASQPQTGTSYTPTPADWKTIVTGAAAAGGAGAINVVVVGSNTNPPDTGPYDSCAVTVQISQGEFFADDFTPTSKFGTSVAISRDGTQAVVSAPASKDVVLDTATNLGCIANVDGCQISRLYFFKLDTTTGVWQQVAEFAPNDFDPACVSATSCPSRVVIGPVAMSGDGLTAAASVAVQQPGEMSSTWSEQVVTFSRASGTWTATPPPQAPGGGTVLLSGGQTPNYGINFPDIPIALDDTGDELLVSLPNQPDSATSASPEDERAPTGEVLVYTNAGDGDSAGFGAVHETIADPTSDPYPAPDADSWSDWEETFGATIALSGDGRTALFSDTSTYDGGPVFGSLLDSFTPLEVNEQVDVYTRSAGTPSDPRWTGAPTQVLTGNDVLSGTAGIDPGCTGDPSAAAPGALCAEDYGGALALSDDGTSAFIGDDGHNAGAGAVYVYGRTGTQYAPAAELTSSDGEVDGLGGALASSVDGRTLVAGAPGSTVDDNPNAGRTELFNAGPHGWSTVNQTTEYAAPDASPAASFGWSVAVASDPSGVATTVMAGAPLGGALIDPLVPSDLAGYGTGAVYTFTAPAPTSTALTAPSLTAIPGGGVQGTTGEAVDLTATVSPAPAAGTVEFDQPDGTPVPGCEQVPVAAGTGIAKCAVTLPDASTISFPTGGAPGVDTPLSFVAKFSGTGSSAASTSAPLAATAVYPIAITTTTLPTWSSTSTSGGNAQLLGSVGGVSSESSPWPLTWSVAPGSTLPGDLTLSSDGELTGAVSTPGSYTFTVQLTDDSPVPQTATQTFTLVSVSTGNTLKITTSSLPAGVVGRSYPFTSIFSTGGDGEATTFSASGLPPGLSLSANGTLYSATAIAAAASGTWPVSITASQVAAEPYYPAQSDTVTLNLTITSVAALEPGPPTDVTAVPPQTNAGLVKVSWQPPLGATDITNYVILPSSGQAQYALNPQANPNAPVPTFAYVPGPGPGQSETFKVEATNGYGTGPASAPSNAVTGQGVTEQHVDQGTSGSSAGTVTVGDPDGDVTATGTGAGTLTVGDYGDNPEGDLAGGETFVDVKIAPGSSFSKVVITVCGGSPPGGLQWWNATSGAWAPVSPQSPRSGDCITATITATSDPSLSQLTGTPFALVSDPTQFTTEQETATATSASGSGTAVATTIDGAATASASGAGTVVVDSLASNVLSVPLPAGETFGDLTVVTPNSFGSVVLKVCGPAPPSQLMWFAPDSQWVPFAQQSAPVGDCISTTLTSTSTPSLAQISSSSVASGSGFEYALTESSPVPSTQVPGGWADDINRDGSFGEHLAVSGDGSTALAYAGHSVEVFSATGTGWKPTAMLVSPTPQGSANDASLFGSGGVALSDDGKTALIDDPSAYVDGTYASGAVFVMKDVDGTWTKAAELNRPPGDTQGIGQDASFGDDGVSLSADGTVAMVVQRYYGVIIYADVAGTWVQQAVLQSGLTATQLSDGDYGSSASMSSSGTTVAIGADQTYDAATPACSGAIYFYADVDGAWTAESTFTHCSIDALGEQLADEIVGDQVALSGDGNTAFVSSSDADPANGLELTTPGPGLESAFDVAGSPSGVYVLNTGDDWATTPTPSSVLSAPRSATPDYTGRSFGLSTLSANADGSEVLIGDSDSTDTLCGANPALNTEWVYRHTSDGWTPTAALRASTDVRCTWFGETAALSENGCVAMVADGGFSPQSVNLYGVCSPPGEAPPGPLAAGSSFIPLAPAPTVTRVSPPSGEPPGGNQVVITGTGFLATGQVQFGTSQAVRFTIDSSTQITATVPVGSGTVDVRVTAGGLTSATSVADQYTYAATTSTTTSTTSTTSSTSTTATSTTATTSSTTTTSSQPPTTTTTTKTTTTTSSQPPTTTTTTKTTTTPPPTTTTTTTASTTPPPVTTSTTTSPTISSTPSVSSQASTATTSATQAASSTTTTNSSALPASTSATVTTTTATSSAVPPAARVLACTGAQIVLVDVQLRGDRVLLRGAAYTSDAGRRVLARLTDGERTVASGTIAPDGWFTLTASAPPASIRDTNRARYEVFMGSAHSEALKLTRRASLQSATLSRAGVLLKGGVDGPFRPGARVSIKLRVTCAVYRTVATVALTRSGTFTARVPRPTEAEQRIAAYRAQTTVLYDGRPSPTYTLLVAPSPAS